MKVILGCVLFFALNAHAITLPNFAGQFSFSKNDLTLEQVQHRVFLSAGTSVGIFFLEQLKQQNYICEHMYSSYHLCNKFLENFGSDREVSQKLIEKNSKIQLSFVDSSDEYELINDAPSLIELAKNQKSNFDGIEYNRIHFFVIPDLIKFKIYQSNGASEEHFYMNSKNQVAKLIMAQKINKKPNASVIEDKYIYVYEGVWKQ